MPGISRSFLNLYRDRSHYDEYFSGWSEAQIAEATLYVASLSAAAMGRRRMMSSVRSTALSILSQLWRLFQRMIRTAPISTA